MVHSGQAGLLRLLYVLTKGMLEDVEGAVAITFILHLELFQALHV